MINLPNEFLARIKALVGNDYAKFLSSYNQKIKKSGHINQAHGERAIDGIEDFMPLFAFDSNCFTTNQTSLGANILHEAGAYYCQEPSAMLPVLSADIAKGSKVLDMCASPGGKSSQIASIIGQSGHLVSNEIMPNRVGVLKENMVRLGYNNVTTISADPKKIAELCATEFDVVVVDAPCSGEGMFSKSELAISGWSVKNVLACSARQMQIIDSAVQCVKAGGKLVYSTCTFASEENEQVVDYIISKGFELVPLDSKFDAITSPARNGKRCYPHIFGRGQFFSVLRKTDESISSSRAKSQKSKASKDEQRVSKAELSFLGEIMDTSGLCISKGKGGVFTAVGTGAFNYGVTLIKNTEHKALRPSHHLFKAYAHRVHNKVHLTESQAKTYLKGEQLQLANPPKGWAVVLYEGWPLGGGKGANNHYKKG